MLAPGRGVNINAMHQPACVALTLSDVSGLLTIETRTSHRGHLVRERVGDPLLEDLALADTPDRRRKHNVRLAPSLGVRFEDGEVDLAMRGVLREDLHRQQGGVVARRGHRVEVGVDLCVHEYVTTLGYRLSFARVAPTLSLG
jgi:hypothetical protein